MKLARLYVITTEGLKKAQKIAEKHLEDEGYDTVLVTEMSYGDNSSVVSVKLRVVEHTKNLRRSFNSMLDVDVLSGKILKEKDSRQKDLENNVGHISKRIDVIITNNKIDKKHQKMYVVIGVLSSGVFSFVGYIIGTLAS